MVDVGKREDLMLEKISRLVQANKRARKLIAEFTLADTTLWPILAEIDLTLSAATDD